MLTLKERLAALREIQALKLGGQGAAGSGSPAPAAEQGAESVALRDRRFQVDISAVVPAGEGADWDTPFGPCFHREVRYPVFHRHGRHSLGEALVLPPEVGGRLVRPRQPAIELRQAAFLDTETTGLAGGTGTVAFLIGLGHFDGPAGEEEFVLHQFFLRDHSGEAALLHAVGETLRPFPFLVTFNGRRFDWPLLETRFTVSRMRPSLPAPAHLDLLYPAWALWKRRLGSCRLANLEANILGAGREEDVPGWLIPQLYFSYLRSGDATPLGPVLHHNLLDILSLVALTAAVGNRLHAPERGLSAEDLLAVGRFYEREGEAEVATQCYREASGDGSCCREALRRLGVLAKRQRRYELAEEAWDRLAREHGSLEALIELAKLYEHRYGDPARASEVTERAIALVRHRAQQYRLGEATILPALERRLARLTRKLAKRA